MVCDDLGVEMWYVMSWGFGVGVCDELGVAGCGM